MSETSAQTFEQLNRQLQEENIILSAAEVHGMLTGLIASSAPSKEREWLAAMADLANEGQKFSDSMINTLEVLQQQTIVDLASHDLDFQLILPSDDEPLSDRLTALTEWAQCFLVGFGIHQQNLAKASDDLKEAIQDLAEIARLSSEVATGEDDERAYYEVSEYVRITAIMCFNELGSTPAPSVPSNSTLH
ncbi:YecA family protein [Aliidiomarina shirensis]|uniref:YecA family protein n=1 Tax=Aliidiomarina shirensis TaxID=1048642 RepID=A0A432WQM9_9GAMM|nr:UPF0149 family protein [Aliidiomarina shirensis]RUO36112.1 YecA family protein [Aliidiomarina shirensis]